MPCLKAHHSVGARLCSAPTMSRKTVKFIKISAAPSIDGNRSTATDIKSDAPVSGGAYQDIRKVTTEWNARLKHCGPPKIRGSMHPASPSTLFSPIFSLARKDRAAGGIRQLQICDSNPSGASRQHPYPFCPFGTFPPDRGNRPLGGEPFLLRRDMKNPRFRVETGGGLMEIKLLPLPSWRLR